MNYQGVRNFFEVRNRLVPREDYDRVLSVIEEMEKRETPEIRAGSDAAKARGNEAFMEGHLEEALAHYTEALSIDPLNYLVYSNRAIVYSRLNRREEGIRDCLAGLKIDPTFVKFYIRLGMFYADTDRAKANEYIREGLRYEPDNKHLRELAESTGAEPPSAAEPESKLASLLKNSQVQDAVKNFVKDKSPAELAEMMQNALKGFKK